LAPMRPAEKRLAHGRQLRAAWCEDHPTREFSRRAIASRPGRASEASQGSRRSKFIRT
jgi:hypothetical protein